MTLISDWTPIHSNFCIYCGKKDNLTSEHVIPFSLGGTIQIHNASCTGCAEITSKFERTVARKMLGNFRVKFNAPTRRKSERPSALMLNVIRGSEKIEIKLNPEEHPAAVFLPVFSPPRIFTGKVGADKNLHQPMKIWSWPALENLRSILPKDLPSRSAVHMGTFDINAFVRTLAKIAHCNSFALYGQGVFNPLLKPLILGETKEYSNYIGESRQQLKESNQYIAATSFVQKNYGTWFLVSTIHLFPNLNGPSYDVIVGTCVDQSSSIAKKMPGSGLC